MKTKLFFIILLLLTSFPSYAFRQKEGKKLSVSGQIGYGNLVNGTSGLTKNTKGYVNQIASGFTWDGEIYYQPLRIFGLGILYTGYTSKATHKEGSDHIYTHYVGPQMGFSVLQFTKWIVKLQTGVGSMNYYNSSKVFGKDRKVYGSTFASNMGGSIEYKLSDLIGISLRFTHINSFLHRSTIYYHDQRIVVEPSFFQKNIDLSSINITLGATLHF